MREVIILYDIQCFFIYIYIFVVENSNFYYYICLFWLSLQKEMEMDHPIKIIDGTNFQCGTMCVGVILFEKSKWKCNSVYVFCKNINFREKKILNKVWCAYFFTFFPLKIKMSISSIQKSVKIISELFC